MRRLELLAGRATQRVDAASYVVFRFLIGMAGVALVVRAFAHGWIEQLYVRPKVFLSYPGLEFLRPLPQPWLELQFVVLAVAALCFALGFRTRLCLAVFLVNFLWIELIDQTTYVNHYYFLALVCGWLWVVEPYHHKDSHQTERWVLWLLRAQVGVIYFFAGVAKLDAPWLLHGQPLRTWLFQHSDAALVGPILALPVTALLMSWMGALFDLTVVGFLLWPRSRPYAFAAVVAFHVVTGLLFPSLGLFPWLMIGAVTIFFEPTWPKNGDSPHFFLTFPRLPDRSKSPVTSISPKTIGTVPGLFGSPIASIRPKTMRTVPLLVVGMVVQCWLPLRHFMVPGDVDWNEAGYRFSWRVMRNEKAGFVRYQVCDRERPLDCQRVAPETFLTPLQVERMAHQPSMIVMAAKLLARRHQERSGRPVIVRADAWVSMNGTTARRLIDPQLDLVRSELSQLVLPFSETADPVASVDRDLAH